jgi:hypothetical protein
MTVLDDGGRLDGVAIAAAELAAIPVGDGGAGEDFLDRVGAIATRQAHGVTLAEGDDVDLDLLGGGGCAGFGANFDHLDQVPVFDEVGDGEHDVGPTDLEAAQVDLRFANHFFDGIALFGRQGDDDATAVVGDGAAELFDPLFKCWHGGISLGLMMNLRPRYANGRS